MNSTKIGKWFVFANLIFSLALLAWATMIYVNHIEWTEKVDQGRPGELAKRKPLVAAGEKAVGIAEQRLRAGRAQVDAFEAQRPRNQKWYDDNLKAVQTGAGGNRDAPVLEVAHKDGLRPVVQNEKVSLLPVMVKAKTRQGKDLFCNDYYVAQLAAARRAMDAEQKALVDATKEDQQLTEQLIGEKGLHQRMFDEKTKKLSVEAELEALKAPQFNSLVETELLEQRRGQLRERVEELKKVGAAGAGS